MIHNYTEICNHILSLSHTHTHTLTHMRARAHAQKRLLPRALHLKRLVTNTNRLYHFRTLLQF